MRLTPQGKPKDRYIDDPRLEREVDRASMVYQRTESEWEEHLPGYGAGKPRMRKHGPHAGKGPKGYKISDEWIWENVCDALYRSYDVDASDIEVEVKDSEVWLRGTVDDRETKRNAEDAAYNVEGVKDVHTELRTRRKGPFLRRPRIGRIENEYGTRLS